MDAELLSSLLPRECGAQARGFYVDPDEMFVDVVIMTTTGRCPCCGIRSDRIHSQYQRQVRDLPCVGRRLRLAVTARRFFCANPDCSRRVFCERIEELTTPYARTTTPLARSHQAIGMALGGEAGARLAKTLAVPTSPDTLIRRVRSARAEPGTPMEFAESLGRSEAGTHLGAASVRATPSLQQPPAFTQPIPS